MNPLTPTQLFRRGIFLMVLAIVCAVADHGRHCGLFLLTIIFGWAGMALILLADKRDPRG